MDTIVTNTSHGLTVGLRGYFWKLCRVLQKARRSLSYQFCMTSDQKSKPLNKSLTRLRCRHSVEITYVVPWVSSGQSLCIWSELVDRCISVNDLKQRGHEVPPTQDSFKVSWRKKLSSGGTFHTSVDNELQYDWDSASPASRHVQQWIVTCSLLTVHCDDECTLCKALLIVWVEILPRRDTNEQQIWKATVFFIIISLFYFLLLEVRRFNNFIRV